MSLVVELITSETIRCDSLVSRATLFTKSVLYI